MRIREIQVFVGQKANRNYQNVSYSVGIKAQLFDGDDPYEAHDVLRSIAEAMLEEDFQAVGAPLPFQRIAPPPVRMVPPPGMERPPATASLPRTPHGFINNCALAFGDTEENCQMCEGKCPDAARFQTEDDDPDQEDPFVDS